jgi:excisionase family DNA binding protein
VALLNVKQTAERLGVSERMVRELIYKRQIPFHKIGKRLVRFDEDDLEAWLLANRTPVRRPFSDVGFGDRS